MSQMMAKSFDSADEIFLNMKDDVDMKYWPAPSKWSNPNVRIGFGFKRRHAALPL